MPVFYCLLTVSAAFIFWSGAGAVAFALAVLAAQAVLGILPEGVQSFLLPVTPQAAIHNLAGMSPPGILRSRQPAGQCGRPRGLGGGHSH